MSDPDEAMVEAVMAAIRQADYECEMAESVQMPFASWTEHQARAALSVPVVRDALARDAQVREIATKWPERRNEPWPLTLALEVADEIAHLYPSPGDDSDIMPGSEFDGPVVL